MAFGVTLILIMGVLLLYMGVHNIATIVLVAVNRSGYEPLNMKNGSSVDSENTDCTEQIC